jgi:hypothetical protein
MLSLALFLAILVLFVGFIVAMVRVTLAPRRIRRWYEDREADERKVAFVLYGGRGRHWSDRQAPRFGAETGLKMGRSRHGGGVTPLLSGQTGPPDPRLPTRSRLNPRARAAPVTSVGSSPSG